MHKAPIKRHPSFQSLSREHHDGLLLAARLQQGVNALPRLWSLDPTWQAEYVVRFFDDILGRHFTVEETVIGPAIRTDAEFPEPILARLFEEHATMRTMVEDLRAMRVPELSARLRLLGENLERHIRWEERELFPLCERSFPAAELELLGKRLGS